MSNSWYDDFLALRAAVVRAVSLAWVKDHPGPPPYVQGVPDDPRKEFYSDFISKDNAVAAMKKWCNYDYPFETILNVTASYDQKDPFAGGPPDAFLPEFTGGWAGVNNTIVLTLPPRPSDPTQWAEALAAYNQRRPFFLSYPSPKSDPDPKVDNSFPRSGPAKTAGTFVQVRSGPGTAFRVLGTIDSAGTRISVTTQVHGEVIDDNDRWDRIQDSILDGYISDQYVTFDDE